MNERAIAQLENSAGQALIALGVYSACFDAMTLAFKLKMRTQITLHEPAALDEFERKCKRAAGTLEFCPPRLVALGALNSADLHDLNALRERRNEHVHESPYHILTLTLADIDADLRWMAEITSRVNYWAIPGSDEEGQYPGYRVSFSVEPTFVTSIVRRIATNLVSAHFEDDPARPPRPQMDA